MEENSISIINRTNGALTGEHAQALPVQFISSWSWTRYVLVGVVLTLVVVGTMIAFAQKQVTVVEVTGKSQDFQLFQVQ